MQAKITVVGLGSGDETQLTLGVLRKLQQAGRLFLRTADHPVVPYLNEQCPGWHSFDELYEASATFESVYEAIAERLIAEARQADRESGDIVYAVPGHPLVAEYTVQLLRERCPRQGIALQLLGGESFLDQAFLSFGFDPIDGFQLFDGSDFEQVRIDPRKHSLIAQIYDVFTASEVKLGLMEHFPHDYPVYAGYSLGVEGEQRIAHLPLYELDRQKQYGNLLLVWVPRTERMDIANRSFQHLLDQIANAAASTLINTSPNRLSPSSLKDTAAKLSAALATDDPDAVQLLAGDLLLQLLRLVHSEENIGSFSFADIVCALNERLNREHAAPTFKTEENDNNGLT
jgi:tetrapyrrole methylase family protein/MazG family protein